MEINLPSDIPTFPDGRTPIRDLYAAYLTLHSRYGWNLDLITTQLVVNQDRSYEIPILGLTSPNPYSLMSVYKLAGTHGEEPAPVMAVAESIDEIARLAKDVPIALLPLQNANYVIDWRYPDEPRDHLKGHSVSDCSRSLPAWSSQPVLPQAEKLTGWIIYTSRTTHPPGILISHHEDEHLSQGYVYALGEYVLAHTIAAQMIEQLRITGLNIQSSGQTRFGETINHGLIYGVGDGSPEELVTAPHLLENHTLTQGLGGIAAFTIETPIKNTPLSSRVTAHKSILQRSYISNSFPDTTKL